MKTVRDAANNLLIRNEISKREYDALEKVGVFDLEKNAAFGVKGIKSFFQKGRNLFKRKPPVSPAQPTVVVMPPATPPPQPSALSKWNPTGRIGQATKSTLSGIRSVTTATRDMLKNDLAAIAGLGMLAYGGKELIVDPSVRRHRQRKAFELMSTKVPQLKGADPQKVKDYFGVIKTFSPTSATNPLVAGALVNKMMSFENVDHKLVQDLASIQKDVTTPSVIQKAMEESTKGVAKGLAL